MPYQNKQQIQHLAALFMSYLVHVGCFSNTGTSKILLTQLLSDSQACQPSPVCRADGHHHLMGINISNILTSFNTVLFYALKTPNPQLIF